MSDGSSGTAPVVVTPTDNTVHIFSAATSVYTLFAGRVVSAVALPVYTPAFRFGRVLVAYWILTHRVRDEASAVARKA